MVDFPASPTSGQEFILGNVTWTWDGVKWTALPGALSIPDAPVDGQLYGRKDASWALATGGSGGIADAPSDGTLYGRKDGSWLHVAHTDITDWTATLAPYALTASVPVASSTTPAMDGTAAVGTGTTWARADHVHPTDTSRYAASNPSGYQTAAQVTASLASYLPLAGGTLTGALGGTSASFSAGVTASGIVTGGNLTSTGSVTVNTAFNTPHYFTGQSAGQTRWAMRMGNGTTESGSNVGADWELDAYNDAGTVVNFVPIFVRRSTGVTTFSSAIVNGPSDATLKDNIAPLEGALDKVLALQGVSFNMIATPEKREIGLIAQAVEPVVPEIIQTYTYFDAAAQRTDETKLALDYPKLTALLIEAVKTLAARIAELEAARG